MDLNNLDGHLQMANLLGYTLNIDEKIKLEMSVLKLAEANPEIDQFKFWGRIETTGKPYYIVNGLEYTGKYEFPHKKFFWASNKFDFLQLPQLFQQHKELATKFKSMFSGDANKMLVEMEAPAEGEPPAEEIKQDGDQVKKAQKNDEDDDMVVLPKKNFTELHRLSITVRAIESDCHIVPIGGYRMLPNHQLRPNKHFSGLDLRSATNANNWQHFRSPQSQQKRVEIEKEDVIFKGNFLDGISNDEPRGCWSIQSDCTQFNVTVRSLKWMGYFAYLKVNTQIFGSAYFGDGLKNIDLAFML